MSDPELCLVPQPMAVRHGQGGFRLSADTVILLLPGAGAQEHFSARMLQEETLDATGLALPEYQHLAESAAGWSLSPVVEGTYTLLDDLFADLLPAFTSRTFNIAS